MSLKIRTYVSSRVLGNSLSICSTLGAKQCRSASSWQNAHRNLFGTVNIMNISQIEWSLHAISPLRECLDDQILIFISPSAHFLIRLDDRRDVLDNIPLLSTLLMEGYSEGC